LTLALAHVIVSTVRLSNTPRAQDFIALSQRDWSFGGLCWFILSIMFCAWMPGRKMDAMVLAFLLDPLNTLNFLPTLGMSVPYIKEHL